VLETTLEPLEVITQRRMLQKLLNVKDNTGHTLSSSVETTECVQPEVSSAQVQHRTVREITPTSRNSLTQ